MKSRRATRDEARRFFPHGFSDRERAVFEAGIALGSLFHSLMGLPATSETKRVLEKAFAVSFGLQPFRERVRVSLKNLPPKKGVYGYSTVETRNVEAVVVVTYGKATVEAKITFVPNLNYPLMHISKVIEKKGVSSAHPCNSTRREAARRNA